MKEISLSKAAEISSGLVINRFRRKNESSGLKKLYKYQHVTLKSVENNNIDLNLLETIESEREIDDKYLLKKGDIIIKLSPPYNAAFVNFDLGNIVVPQNFAIIRSMDNFDPEYLSYILNSQNIRNQLQRRVEGGALPIIKLSSLNQVKLKQIDLKIQHKYAKLFSLLSRKKELKKRIIELEAILTENILSNL
ncbi:restriction endonuclease subunit S [Methanobacterium alcaliphilum]|uniref:restriction endonuclease subunit S n=1 Tax=Methanobacterium alcaliphilum TaxID=392018 RepID=UPI00200A8402|nr:restriction endonuclease subunit S [Methanobacterium alcaliphilum]MCK9151537.1 restriction endonuclease subunit S [Methanobacterium alcaliphilum]